MKNAIVSLMMMLSSTAAFGSVLTCETTPPNSEWFIQLRAGDGGLVESVKEINRYHNFDREVRTDAVSFNPSTNRLSYAGEVYTCR